MKFYLISLGCQMNMSDSERVKTVFADIGFTETKDETEAQILGVMACSVRQKAIDRVYSLIHKWNTWKNSKTLITFISGCILPADKEKFLKKFDLLFSINELPQLPEALLQYGVHTAFSAHVHADTGSIPVIENTQEAYIPQKNYAIPAHNTQTKDSPKDILAKGFWHVPPTYSSQFEAYVTIQNGCDKFCTFCAVPYTRGREVSRPSSEILQEVYHLIEKGYKSITLLGQNVNSYGLDTHGSELSFAQLLSRIGNITQEKQHDCWVYFTSPHPRDMTKDVLEVIAQYPALAQQIHLPIQSGDDKLLMKMNRNHSVSKYRTVVQDIKEVLPNATLFTDIIVGFCGETEEQFAATKHAMQEFAYNMAYIAMYSPRPGAASYRWQDTVPLNVKKERYHELSKVLQYTAQQYNQKFVGTTQKVLVDSIGRNGHTLNGRTEGKIPVQVTNTTDHAHATFIGTFVDVHVTASPSLSLAGETIGASI